MKRGCEKKRCKEMKKGREWKGARDNVKAEERREG